ncbi:MAG TPA: 4Fe-4S binding protein [Magnetospirillaceae bacterium]|nr:4Fe-4S binding protein [Magnetospirillaceae bacterium]
MTDRARRAAAGGIARARGVLAALWLAAFCAGVALPATEFPETAPLAAALARTQPLHALNRALQGRAGLSEEAASAAAAAAAVAAAFALAILGGTLVFGRFHCSLLCPLGTCQDAAARLAAGLRSPRRGPPGAGRGGVKAAAVRWGAAALAAFGFAAGTPAAAALLEPYSVFARGFQRSLGDLTALGLNTLAAAGARIPVLTVRWETFAFFFAVLPFGAVLAAAAVRSRAFCGALCPAGALLGVLNRAALLRLRLYPAACVGCGACSRACRARCVDGLTLDASRCVQCLDCAAVCPTGALRYGPPRRVASVPAAGGLSLLPSPGRRDFLASAGAAAAGAVLSLAAPSLAAGSDLPLIRAKPLGPSGRPLAAPPGAREIDRYAALCTACGTCVRACPSGVLKHSSIEFGLGRPGVPFLYFGRAFCQFECVACPAACPSGALLYRGLELKKREAVGKSRLLLSDCIVVSRGTRCGACAEHCPTGAIRIERVEGRRLPIPVLHAPTCIGCGACETVCPSTPIRAMTVSGLAVHEIADPPRKEPQEPVKKPPLEGFAF